MPVESQHIELPEILDISCCNDLWKQLVAALATSNSCVIDTRRVRKLSTPCVQILVAAGLEAERKGSAYSFGEVSTVFGDAFRNLGLSEYLERWGTNT